MESLISIYPIGKHIFNYLDIKTVIMCYYVSEEFKYYAECIIEKYDYSKLNCKELSNILKIIPPGYKYLVENYLFKSLQCNETIYDSD